MLKTIFKTSLYAVVIATCSFSLGQIPDVTLIEPPTASPIRIEAEDNIVTQIGIGIYDVTAPDEGGSSYVGDVNNGDFVSYSFTAPGIGPYTIDYRVASQGESDGFVMSLDGVPVHSVSIPDTGGWEEWQTISTQPFELLAGVYTIQLDFVDDGQNLNWLQIQPPLGEVLIEAEDYDSMSGIDLGYTTDTGGGQNIGWIDIGDWVEYTVFIPSTGDYLIEYRVAGPWDSCGFEVRFDDILVDAQALETPSGWQSWDTQSSVISLTEGEKTMRLDFIDGPININWIRLTRIEPEISSDGETPINFDPNTYFCNNQSNLNDHSNIDNDQNNDYIFDDGSPIVYESLGEIPDLSLADISVRGRPYIDDSLGYNVIRTDMGTLLRGVSLSTDGGDPYNALNLLDKSDIKLESLQSMVNDYGFNTLHVYLEGDAAQNPDPVGINEELADHLVEITRQAKMYLIITIGNNGENGAIHSMEKVLAFWDLYGTKYKDETHVIYEAHNEPVSGINGYWTDEDWEKQADMYEKIREVAPDTMVLLGSFMSFFGGSQAIKGANDLAAEFPGIWDNAGFAFHAYWDIGQVESTIEAFEASDDYPALLCTEFWPGDTKNGFNEVFESHQIGWTQFEWLGGNDLELDRVKNYLDTYGTAWRPDNPNSTWPASGSPSIPIDQTIGLYSRVDKKFLGLDDQDRVVAGDQSYDGVGSDEFIVVDAGDDGHIALLADNGRYLSVSDYGQPLVASARKIGVKQKFMWLELPTGDIALRPWAGSGHLIGTIASTDGDEFGLTGSVGAGIKRGGANSYRVVTAYTDSIDPLPEIPPVPPGPFFGAPMPVPTNGDHNLPTSAPDNRLYASDYDIGGEGISYHDTGAINLGEAYRPSEGVDVGSSNEGHTFVGFFEDEEWLDYIVDVAQAGNYIITFRTASSGGGFISFESDCEKLTGNLPTPDTGWWNIWQDMTVDVTLKAGVQKLRVVSGGNINFMNMDIQLGGNGGADYGAGCEWQPPEPDDLKVEAEDWTTVVSAPEGSVNINAVATDSDLSLHVGNFDAGDFIEYAVGLPETSCYRAEYRVASYTGSDGFELIFDGETADSFKIPQTGGWDSWVTFTRHYELNAGSQTLRLEALGDSFNVNWLRFNATDAIDCALSAALTVEAETFTNSVQLPNGEVGIQPANDEGGGLNVGWIDAGDWMEYEINVIESGNYSVSYRMASQAGSSSGVNILIDGNQADTAFVPNTGGWQKWQTVDGGTISLEAGQYVLRFEAPGGGLNLNWIKFTPAYQIPTGNIGTGLNDSLDEGETINFNDPVVNYDLIDIGDSLSNLVVDPVDSTNTVVSVIKGAVASSGVNIASGQVNYPLSATLVRLSMRVYSSTVGTSVRIRLEDSSDSAHSVETEALTTVANEWETLVFDFRNPIEGTAALDTDYNFDVLSVFFNYSASGSGETYYLDDITMLEAIDQADTLPVPVPSITSSDLIGSWKLAPVAGALFVDGWSSSLGDVSTRYCLFDDLFTFYGNGAFTNQMNSLTWVEQWQGVSEGCGTPIYPHDGRGRSSFTFDESAMTITLNGKGAHLGIPKAVNGAEYGAGISLAQAPESIVYDVIESTATTMSIKINIQGGKYWIFKLMKTTYDYNDAVVFPDPAAVGPIITSSDSVSIDENIGENQVVYTVTSDNPDATYMISVGDDELSIDQDTGEVTLSVNPDYDAQSQYSFGVIATDGAGNASEPQEVTLTINDPAVSPLNITLISNTPSFSFVAENCDLTIDLVDNCKAPNVDGLTNYQSIYVSSSTMNGNEKVVTFSYASDDKTTTGIGVHIFFDSSEMSPSGVKDIYMTDIVASPVIAAENDTGDGDENPETDKVISVGWASLFGSFPGSNTVDLFTLCFNGNDLDACDEPINNWDFDQSGEADALTDGLLMLRYAFGLRGEALTSGVIASNSSISTAEVEAAVELALAICDIDGDGEVDALTDGLLLLRYMFGLRDEILIDKVVSASAQRNNKELITNYIEKHMPKN